MAEKRTSYKIFMKNFTEPYQPKYGFCPTTFMSYIRKYYDLDYWKAMEIYTIVAGYYGAIPRMNDFLYEQVVLNKTE